MYPCYIWALSTRCPQRPPPALAGGALPVRRPKSVVGQAWRLSRTRRPGDADRRGYALPVPPPPTGFGSPIRSTPCHCIFSKPRNLMFASLIFWSLVSFGASFQKSRHGDSSVLLTTKVSIVAADLEISEMVVSWFFK